MKPTPDNTPWITRPAASAFIWCKPLWTMASTAMELASPTRFNALWPLIVGGVALGLFVLLVGAPIERRIRDHSRNTPAEADRQDIKDRP